MQKKVNFGQTQRRVVNITDSPLTKADLTTALTSKSVAGLRELIVIDGKESGVTRVFPDPQTLK
jgi:hypothetical protein